MQAIGLQVIIINLSVSICIGNTYQPSYISVAFNNQTLFAFPLCGSWLAVILSKLLHDSSQSALTIILVSLHWEVQCCFIHCYALPLMTFPDLCVVSRPLVPPL